MCPVYDVPFRYFIPLNTYAGAGRSTSLSLSFFLSPAQSLRHPFAQPPRATLSLRARSQCTRVSTFLFTFLLIPRRKLRPLIQPRSKYSFATNFHLHVSSPWGLPSSANHAFFFPLTPYRLHLFIPSPRAAVLRPKVVARELKGF